MRKTLENSLRELQKFLFVENKKFAVLSLKLSRQEDLISNSHSFKERIKARAHSRVHLRNVSSLIN